MFIEPLLFVGLVLGLCLWTEQSPFLGKLQGFALTYMYYAHLKCVYIDSQVGLCRSIPIHIHACCIHTVARTPVPTHRAVIPTACTGTPITTLTCRWSLTWYPYRRPPHCSSSAPCCFLPTHTSTVVFSPTRWMSSCTGCSLREQTSWSALTRTRMTSMTSCRSTKTSLHR